MTLVTLAGLVKLPDYAGACFLAAARVAARPVAPDAWTHVEGLLAILLLVWILFPLISRSVDPNGPGLSAAALRRFPLSPARLFLVSFAGNLVQPVYWILIAASLVALVPLVSGGQPVAGAAAGLVYLVICALVPALLWLLVAAFLGLRRRWLLPGAAALLFGLAWTGIRLEPLLHADSTELAESLKAFLAALPGHLVALAASGNSMQAWRSVGVLVLVAIAVSAAVLLLMKRLLDHPVRESNRSQRLSALPDWPGRPGTAPLVAKELVYATRTLDFWIGMALSASVALYVLLAKAPPLPVVLIGIITIGLNQAVGALNSFGLDHRAVDRYRLLPLDGGRILESRNTAWLLVAAATLLPVGLAAFVRFGFLTGLAIAAGAAGALFGNAAWGNLVSVRRPSPRPFFSMESSDQAGGIVGAVISLAFWILPLLLTLFALQSGLPAVVVVNILWAALAGAAWRLLLKPSGTAFEREAETMRARLRG